jgi:hypothetical protein
VLSRWTYASVQRRPHGLFRTSPNAPSTANKLPQRGLARHARRLHLWKTRPAVPDGKRSEKSNPTNVVSSSDPMTPITLTRSQRILTLLEGGDRRSVGRADEVAALVSRNPKLFPQLIAGLWSDDPLVRMRAADAAEKVTRTAPQLLPN